MSVATHVMKKRCREDNGNPEKPPKEKKVAESDVCQNQQESEKTNHKKKKPQLSASPMGQDCEISYDQLYGLLKYAALGKHHNVSQASWCRIHHQKRLAGVVVVVLPGVGQLHFDRFYLHFKHLRTTFSHRFSLPPLSEEFMENLAGGEAYALQQISKQVMQNDPIIEKYGEERHGLARYILTQEEMRLNNYPLEGFSEGRHFVHTQCCGPVTDNSPLFGLDCEMCLTDKGSELTRISVVDAGGQCVMNELVKPRLPIRNYLTRYSGITAKLLDPITTTLGDIQGRLKKLLPADAVLVGHSLNFDLQALEMIHPNAIDTSVLFARKGSRKFQLKFLADAVLGKKIQCTENGHDPTEDAKCALELARYFISQGPRKVAELNLETRLLVQNRMGKTQKNGRRKPTQCLLDILHSVGQKPLLLGGLNGDVSYGCQKDISSLNKQILQRALEEVPVSSFSVIQFALESQCLTSKQVAEVIGKMRTKLAAMLTIYAGPFSKDFCLKSLRSIFKKYGHIQSISVIKETFKPHICVQYEVLEAAQLALESLNGAEVAGSLIKVQRPVTEATLECDVLVKELEKDRDNRSNIYLSGFEMPQSETELQEELSYLEDLSSIFMPKDPRTGKQRNYCFLKFRSPESASSGLQILEEKITQGSQLQCRRALTPAHFYHWSCHAIQNGGKVFDPLLYCEADFQEKQPISIWEEDLKKELKVFDHRIKKLYQHLPDHTLCVILLPGTNRSSEAIPGFGLLGIKEDSYPSSW